MTRRKEGEKDKPGPRAADPKNSLSGPSVSTKLGPRLAARFDVACKARGIKRAAALREAAAAWTSEQEGG